MTSRHSTTFGCPAANHHAGILLVHQQRWSVGEILRRLERLLAARTAEDMVDRLEWLSDWGEGD